MASKKLPTAARPAVLQLPEKLNSAAAQGLWSEVSEKQGQSVCLDASRVSVLGAQCLQILLAARKSWDATDHAFEVAHMSEKMGTALVGFGLAADQIGASEVRHGA